MDLEGRSNLIMYPLGIHCRFEPYHVNDTRAVKMTLGIGRVATRICLVERCLKGPKKCRTLLPIRICWVMFNIVSFTSTIQSKRFTNVCLAVLVNSLPLLVEVACKCNKN